MTAPEILTATPSDLPEIADYIYRTELRNRETQTDLAPVPVRSAAENLATLRWQVADTPLTTNEIGFKLRSADGNLVGVHLVSPLAFRWHERRTVGLASCSFFVDPEYRLQAFYLFKRFLALRGFDFHFASSCNAYSGAIWSKCGGRAVPNTDADWLAPVHIGPLAREVFLRRGRKLIGNTLSWAAVPFDLCMKARKLATGKLRLRQTDDLEFLAQVASQHTNPNWITVDRSLEYLRWMYVASRNIEQKRVFRFEDSAGQPGWVSVSRKPYGLDYGIRLGWLLDWAIPTGFDFSRLVRAVISEMSSECDLLTMRLRPDAMQPPQVFLARRLAHPSPKGYLIPADRSQTGLENAIVMSRADAV